MLLEVRFYSFCFLSGPNIRLSDSPIKGFIEIKDGLTWRKVVEENWDKNRQKLLCQHLRLHETAENNISTRNIGSGQNIATGDLICHNTQPNETSCCIHLEPSTTISRVTLPYATCKYARLQIRASNGAVAPYNF